MSGLYTKVVEKIGDMEINADSIVIAVGSKPVNSLLPELREKGLLTYLAGDCWQVSKIANAISDGYRIGSLL